MLKLKVFQFLKRLKEVHYGTYFSVTVDKVFCPDGKIREYNIVRGKPYPMVIPVDNDGNIHMIEETRYSLRNIHSINFPKGFVDPGETLLEGARRELEEESGGRVEKIIPFAVIHPSDGILEQNVHVFLGKGFHFVKDPRQDPIDKEAIARHVFTVNQVWEKIDSGEIHAAEAIAAFALYTRYCLKELLK